MWDLRDLDGCFADSESLSDRQVGDTQVEVDNQLISCELPSRTVPLAHTIENLRVHQRDLGSRIVRVPTVAPDPLRLREGCFLQFFSPLVREPDEDRFEPSVVSGETFFDQVGQRIGHCDNF